MSKPEKKQGSAAVIGIGASAGGLEALQQFFDYMPSDSGLSFVVIQHLSPDYKSLMADILAKHTDMTVRQAEDGMPVRPDHLYLIPPKKNLTLHEGRLVLSDYDASALNHPIDIFFTSLAEEKREKAIVVVLSGTGSDGTNGVKAVKERGGLVIAQAPESAKFDGMPRSAINTGLADFILTPQEIAEEILNFSFTPALLHNRPGDAAGFGGRRALLRGGDPLPHLCDPEKCERHRLYLLQAHNDPAPDRTADAGDPHRHAGGFRPVARRFPRGGQHPCQGDPDRGDKLLPRPGFL